MKIKLNYNYSHWTENEDHYFPDGVPDDPSITTEIEIEEGDMIEVFVDEDGATFSIKKANGSLAPTVKWNE